MILSNEKKCKAIPPMESNYLILKLSKDCTDTVNYLPTSPLSVFCRLVSYSECYDWNNLENNEKVLIKKIIPPLFFSFFLEAGVLLKKLISEIKSLIIEKGHI